MWREEKRCIAELSIVPLNSPAFFYHFDLFFRVAKEHRRAAVWVVFSISCFGSTRRQLSEYCFSPFDGTLDHLFVPVNGFLGFRSQWPLLYLCCTLGTERGVSRACFSRRRLSTRQYRGPKITRSDQIIYESWEDNAPMGLLRFHFFFFFLRHIHFASNN